MNRKQRIQTILSKELPEWSIELVDDSINHKGHFGLSGNSESHLIINLKDLSNSNINKISLHRKINSLIKKKLLFFRLFQLHQLSQFLKMDYRRNLMQ